MKKLLLLPLLLLFGCGETPATETETEYIPPDIRVRENNSEYLEKYAGTYSVEIVNNSARSSEKFKLHKDRFAEWSWENEDKKYGKWVANQDTITIKIEGNTGSISETFIMQGGKFVEALSGERYLKPGNN